MQKVYFMKKVNTQVCAFTLHTGRGKDDCHVFLADKLEVGAKNSNVTANIVLT